MDCNELAMRCTGTNANCLGEHFAVISDVARKRSIDRAPGWQVDAPQEGHGYSRQHTIAMDAIDDGDDVPEIVVGDAFPNL